MEIIVTDELESPKSGVYRSRWELRVPEFDLMLIITLIIDKLELFTTARYWEGAVDVAGQRDQVTIEGRGYV